MIDKPTLYLLVKTAALAASLLIMDSEEADITRVVISALSFACIFVIELLLSHLFHKDKWVIVTILASGGACFYLGMEVLFPLFVLLFLHLIDSVLEQSQFNQISLVSIIFSFLIFAPKSTEAAISVILILLVVICRYLLEKLAAYERINDDQKVALLAMEEKQNNLRNLIKTLKLSASLEERNRIAARIHDQIGHGISGSIILLEAALLLMKDQPVKSEGSVRKAIHNLREGVDQIRTALREERTDNYVVGIHDITAVLEEFKVTYNKSTQLKTSGDLSHISLELWACIHDNLKECLTNLLKHSNATELILDIQVYQKIIKIEYSDNGTMGGSFEKGLGLEAIEERTIGSKGRCFFQMKEHGFMVTNIFTY